MMGFILRFFVKRAPAVHVPLAVPQETQNQPHWIADYLSAICYTVELAPRVHFFVCINTKKTHIPTTYAISTDKPSTHVAYRQRSGKIVNDRKRLFQ